MILSDTGPMVALLTKGDRHHAASVAVMGSLPLGPLHTTWPCFTEAMYLLGALGGLNLQVNLWGLRNQGRLILLDISESEIQRMSVLMDQYANVPMDLADASLIAVAESRGIKKLFTFDSDFFIYRLSNGSFLEILR